MASSPIPLPPPPPEPASSVDPLWEFYAKWASENGFFIKRSRVNSRDGEIRQIYAQCDRSGAYRPHRPDEPRVREKTSRLTNCPFSLVFALCKRTKLWSARVRNPQHNHEPAMLSTIPSYRAAMTARFEPEIVNLLQKGVPARQIVSTLQARHHFAVISRTNVYEVRRRLKITGAGPTRATTTTSVQQDTTPQLALPDLGPLIEPVRPLL